VKYFWPVIQRFQKWGVLWGSEGIEESGHGAFVHGISLSCVKKIFEIGGGKYETFRLGSDVGAGLFWVQMGG